MHAVLLEKKVMTKMMMTHVLGEGGEEGITAKVVSEDERDSRVIIRVGYRTAKPLDAVAVEQRTEERWSAVLTRREAGATRTRWTGVLRVGRIDYRMPQCRVRYVVRARHTGACFPITVDAASAMVGRKTLYGIRLKKIKGSSPMTTRA